MVRSAIIIAYDICSYYTLSNGTEYHTYKPTTIKMTSEPPQLDGMGDDKSWEWLVTLSK